MPNYTSEQFKKGRLQKRVNSATADIKVATVKFIANGVSIFILYFNNCDNVLLFL
jgi:hypothetical protein